MPPHKHPKTRNEVLWSEWVESVRKDIECFFGKMKARWQFLKNPNRHHSAQIIESAFQCCCIINNMLLDDSSEAETQDERTEENLDALHPDFNDPAEEELAEEGDVIATGPNIIFNVVDANNNLNVGGKRNVDAIEMTMFNFHKFTSLRGPSFSAGCSDFDKLRRALTNSFLFQFTKGYVTWPSRMTGEKNKGEKMFEIEQRVQETADSALYIEDSSIYSYNDANSTNVGRGLFSRICFDRGDTIAFFNGKLSNVKDLNDKRVKDKKRIGYAVVSPHSHIYLDTFDSYAAGKCWASYANSTWSARYKDVLIRENVLANAELFYTMGGKIGLRATRSIWHDTEILWDGYGYKTSQI